MIKCRLFNLLGDRKMSVLALKRETNLSYVALIKLYHEKTSGVTFNTIDRICKSLECSMEELFEYIEE